MMHQLASRCNCGDASAALPADERYQSLLGICRTLSRWCFLLGALLVAMSLHAVALSQSPPSSDTPSSRKSESFELVFPAMGSSMMIRAFDTDETKVERAFATARSIAGKLEDIYTDYDPESETSQLTARATVPGGVSVSGPLWEMLCQSDAWYRKTSGAFDASLGSLTSMWRKAKRSKVPPDDAAVKAALEKSGWHHVHLDREQKKVHFDRDGIRLDFGAIAKGYIVDKMFESLQQAGIRSCLVNASGNIRCGDPPPGLPGWQIEVAQLDRGSRPIQAINLVNQSIATSGDLWQFQVVNGVRRSHILDPKTGCGISGSISATIIAPTAAEADACATAACVLGSGEGTRLVADQSGWAAIVLYRERKDTPVVYRSLGLE